MSSWSSYPKVYAIGHAAIRDIFKDPVLVEEKVDGSQISFGRFNGELKIRSKGKEQYPQTDKMFLPAIESISSLDLRDGWTYSGEYLSKPKHNTLPYGRVPKGLIILFDIRTAEELYVHPVHKQEEANRIGLECVPLLLHEKIESPEKLLKLLETESALGGQKIEGVVVKNYTRFTRDGKAMIGKYVSESFKEKNKKDFRLRHPTQGDVLEKLCDMYRTEARWRKAVQHLKESGKLEHSPRDIGPLMKEVQEDLRSEEAEAIKEALFKWAWNKIGRRSVAGLAEWYKENLLRGTFE